MKLWGCVRCGGLFARRMLDAGFKCRVACTKAAA